MIKSIILALFTTLDCGAAFAQTTAPADTGTQVLVGSPTFVDSAPRPTFYFSIAPSYRNFTSALITWGTGSTKDGISIKPIAQGGYSIKDVYKIGDVITADSSSDIYASSYNPSSGRLSFIRAWDTGDSKNDVALNKSEANSFQWEVLVGNTRYVGSYSRTFIQVAALLENQGSDSSVGFPPGLKAQNLFSNWTAHTVLPTKPPVENFAENFQLQW